MLRLDCFKAGKGDSFLLTWDATTTHRLLIDAGSAGTYRFIRPHVKTFGKLDAVLITHVDYDHIGGFFKWMADQQQPFNKEIPVYMNTPELLLAPIASDKVAVKHGVILEQLLNEKGIRAVPIYLDQSTDATMILHGLKLHFLSPNLEVIRQLLDKWTATAIYRQYQLTNQRQNNKVSAEKETLRDAKAILDDPPKPHTWEDDLLNASSIAFILEYRDTRLLFLGDANPTLVSAELERMGYTRDHRLALDLVKISHHGSKHNTTQDLLERISCSQYMISTDSSGPYYHPARETLILISAYGRPCKDDTIHIYSNYSLAPEKLLTDEEQQTSKLYFKAVNHLEFTDK